MKNIYARFIAATLILSPAASNATLTERAPSTHFDGLRESPSVSSSYRLTKSEIQSETVTSDGDRQSLDCEWKPGPDDQPILSDYLRFSASNRQFEFIANNILITTGTAIPATTNVLIQNFEVITASGYSVAQTCIFNQTTFTLNQCKPAPLFVTLDEADADNQKYSLDCKDLFNRVQKRPEHFHLLTRQNYDPAAIDIVRSDTIALIQFILRQPTP